MNMKQIITAIVSIALGTFITSSHANEYPRFAKDKLYGTYHVVITETCVRTPYEVPPANGFDPETRMLLVEGEAVSAIGKAQAHFYPDGTVQLEKGKQTETSPASILPGDTPIVPASIFTGDGTYTLKGKNVTLDLMCSVDHPAPNIEIILGPLTFEGKISRNRKTISLTNLDRVIQTVTVELDGNPIQQRQRVCSQTATFTK